MLQTMYEDFTSQVLPKISDGLTITRDYFFELFGRYVTYLIVIDMLSLAGSLIMLIVVIKIAIKTHNWFKDFDSKGETDYYGRPIKFTDGEDRVVGLTVIILLNCFLSFMAVVCIASSTVNLAKDIFIPEVRVYQEIQDFINKE